MTKPLLLIDVDGPLNPWDNKGPRRPPEYGTWRFPLRGLHPRKPWRTWLRPEHGAWLLSLKDSYELTWCTAWQDEANKFIGPVLDLPELPWIRFPGHRTSEWISRGWKYPEVAEYAAGRPLAWIDDDFDAVRLQRHRAQFECGRSPIPTLLHPVSPKTGLSREDITALADWASTIA